MQHDVKATRTRSGIARASRPIVVATVVASMAVGVPMLSAGAPAAGCTSDGTVSLVIDAPELGVVGPDLPLTLIAVDSCDEVDASFTGTVRVDAAYVDGSGSPGVQATFTAQDAGFLDVAMPLTRSGLTYLLASSSTGGSGILGATTVLAHSATGHPVVDALRVSTGGGSYSVSGVTADPQAPGVPVEVFVRVDGALALQGRADHVAEQWEQAPPSVGAAHGFDLSVPIPPGRHSVCLFVGDRVAPGAPPVPVNVECRLVDGPPTAPATPSGPFGWYDGIFRVPGGYRAAGWAIDPSQPGGTARVAVTGYFLTSPYPGPPQPPLRTEYPPPHTRDDVGDAYPQFGPLHGFVSDSYLGREGTGVRFCVRAGATLDLGCREAVIRTAPVGSLDAVTPVPRGARVRGWSLDLDSYDPVQVHVYVDGVPVQALRAASYRADVDRAFPASPEGWVRGYGGNHGFDETIPMQPGRRTVCVYGINVEGYAGQGGTNAKVGCREVVVPSSDPVGRLDGATRVPGGFSLRGWTADPDSPTQPLQVHTYRDGVGAAISTAAADRPDLVTFDNGRYGTAHGFTTGAVATGADARVCSYAINLGAGQNTTLGCLDLRRPLAPTGALDEATRSGPTTATIRGWALDPDTAAPVDVHVYVDGRPGGVVTARGTRGDVASAYPGWGAQHGYTVTVQATPGQRVCAYAINTLLGAGNTTLGCRTA